MSKKIYGVTVGTGLKPQAFIEKTEHVKDTNIHVTKEEKQTWNNKSNFSGSYNDLTDKPTIPSKASDVGAEASGTSQTKVNEHNVSEESHSDIRLLISGLTTRLNALANSDDVTLDQMSEVVAYIKNNKSLIEQITTNKVNVSDIITNYTTNVTNKPVSASVAVELKALIDKCLTSIPSEYVTETELDQKGYLTQHQDLSGYAKKAITLDGYGITDGATKQELSKVQQEIADQQKQLTQLGATQTIPDFWTDSVNSVIATIKSLQKDGGRNIITFPFFSDNHQRLGYAGILIKKVMNECNIPYCFYGGDSISSGYIADEDTMIEQDGLFDSMMSVIPKGRFKRTVGNHDGYWAVSSSEKYTYTRPQVYDLFLREESVAQNMCFGTDGTYYYVDDLASKTRFVVLNTNGGSIDSEQITWLQNNALKFNESGWAIVFISHQPISNHYHANISNAQNVITIVKNYIDGTDENKADVVGWYSGHVHRDRIYTGIAINTTDDSVGSSLPFKQITITSDHTSIAYDDATKHTVAEDNLSHAIDFVTINKSTKTVNLTRLGIGNNRAYSYDNVILYSITNNLTNVTTNNNNPSIEDGGSYVATLTPNTNYEISSVTVTMGGVDVTSSVYSNGVISITEVTGDIVVTASAEEKAVEVTNLFNADEATLNTRFTSSSTSAHNGVYITDYIDAVPGDVIYFKPLAFDASSNYHKVNCYNSTSDTKIGAKVLQETESSSAIILSMNNGVGHFTVPAVSGTTRIKICLHRNTTNTAITKDDLADVVITKNEPIS
jgi:hypothetical protein